MTTPAQTLGGMGHSVKRKEDPRFLRGRGRYIDDIKLPGMIYMDIVRSPYAHADDHEASTPARRSRCPASSPSSPAKTSTRPDSPGCRP